MEILLFPRNRSQSLKTSDTLRLCESVINFLSPFLALDVNLTWLGKPNEIQSKRCQWCRSDIIKIVIQVTTAVFKTCVDISTVAPTEAYSLAKSCLQCLHCLWSSEQDFFVTAIGESPQIQRQYVWIMKQVELRKTSLNLHPEEGIT